jgi:hypothetical protein
MVAYGAVELPSPVPLLPEGATWIVVTANTAALVRSRTIIRPEILVRNIR